MSRHEEMCPHCRAKAGLDAPADAGAVAEPIELPDAPTPIRVHQPDRTPFDCILHPDGTLTAVLGGEVRRNLATFADMCETNWATAHFEFNPAPLLQDPAAELAPAVVQAAIPMAAA